MKKLFAIVFISLLTQMSFAESGENCNRGGKITEKLGLQEDQVEVVKEIMQAQHEKRRELMQANRDSTKEKMEGIHEETKTKLSSILTPEQMTKFEEAHAQRQEKRQNKRKQEQEERDNSSNNVS